jgi:hypothetical protein
MTEGLFDRYFRLLAGRLPAAEYGVIADSDEEELAMPEATSLSAPNPVCLCRD